LGGVTHQILATALRMIVFAKRKPINNLANKRRSRHCRFDNFAFYGKEKIYQYAKNLCW
jgi:hypothetical protein